MKEWRMFNVLGSKESPESQKERQEIPFDDERFFAVEILKKKRAEVMLKDKSGAVVLDFSTLLPPKYVFELGANWSSDHTKRSIYIGPWNMGRDVIGLMHEIGHGWNDKDHIRLFNTSYHYNRSLVDSRMSQGEKEAAAKELKQAVLASERNAWAWALKESRNVRREKNVDLLKDFKNVKELKGYIDYFLGGYERLVEKVQESELPYAGPMSAQEIEKYLKEE